jgi:DNA-binding response OmpR family regulator
VSAVLRIFLVEDDEKLCLLAKEYLEKYDYEVVTVEDFKNVEGEIRAAKPQLILLDINLPYYDGFHICRMLRQEGNYPIIITSARSGEFEQIRGLEMGADDYITKPYSFELLLAKVKAALRRTYGEYSQDSEEEMFLGKLKIDKDTFKIGYGDKAIELSKNEFKLLNKLIQNKDKVVKREEILEELWDESFFVDDNTLTVNVTRVKSKLSDLGIINAIKTKRGVGYTFDSTTVL